MPNSTALTDTLKAITQSVEGDEISVGEVMNGIETRGFGPMLVVPALILLTPIGAIPGLPDVLGILILIISAQILIGRQYPWLPERLKRVSVDRAYFTRALELIEPSVRRVDRYIYPRLSFLTHRHIQPLIAMVAILLSLSILILSFIPLLVWIPAFGVLALGLGLTAKDGLLLVVALIFSLASLASIPLAWSRYRLVQEF